MNSKLYTFVFSVLFRGFVLVILALVMILFYFGYTPVNTVDFLALVFIEIGFLNDVVIHIITPLFLLVLFIIVFVYSIRKERLVMGIVGFLGRYSFILSVIVIVSSLAMIMYGIYSSVEIVAFTKCVKYIVLGSFVGLLSGLLVTKYPLVSIDLYVVSGTSEHKLSLNNKPISLNGDDIIRVKVFGKPDFSIRVYPGGSMRVSDIVSTTYYYYVEIIPVSSHTSTLEISYKDILIGRYKVVLKNVCLKNIVFTIYYNDDKIYEQSYNIECRKSLLDASKQAIKAALARIGLDITNVRDIQYYTENNVLIPPDITVGDLKENKVLIKLYVVEKYLEVLKYYSRKDVLDLWDSLIKRLEILMQNIPNLEKLVTHTIDKLMNKILFTGD